MITLSAPRHHIAVALGALTILGIAVSFMTWRTFDASFTHDGSLAEFSGTATGLRSTLTTATSDGKDLDLDAITYPTVLALFALLTLVGTVLIAAAKAPRTGAILAIVAGVSFAVFAAVFPSAMFLGDADGDLGELLDHAKSAGTLSTSAGTYLAVLIGLLTAGTGIYGLIVLGRERRPMAVVAPPYQQPQVPGEHYPGQGPGPQHYQPNPHPSPSASPGHYPQSQPWQGQ